MSPRFQQCRLSCRFRQPGWCFASFESQVWLIGRVHWGWLLERQVIAPGTRLFHVEETSFIRRYMQMFSQFPQFPQFTLSIL
jgi:hypothetical protein